MGGDEHYVEERNLSHAWARALRLVTKRGRKEIAPLIVSVTGFHRTGLPVEDASIRTVLDDVLARAGKHLCATVANTIFPESLWNPGRGRARLFQRYCRILPSLRHALHSNSRGLYFDRLISGGPAGKENQLDFAINTYMKRIGVRRSVLQASVFDPHRDHSSAAQLGFPCLQHVTFAPTVGGLCLNAFYATQYMVERAYGNYLGLCRLGRFMAHELDMRLTRMTCFTGIAECDTAKKHLESIFEVINGALGPAVAKNR